MPRVKRSVRGMRSRSFEELYNFIKILLRLAQIDIDIFSGNKINCKSNVLDLTPFLDNDTSLRLGRRLTNSKLSYDKKLLILLSQNHHISTFFMEDKDIRLKHCCAQSLLAAISEEFWIV